MKTFESVAQMKLAKLQAGQLTETKGYYTSGDSGKGRYLIAATQAVDEYGDHTLANANVALLQVSGTIDVLTYGAAGDGTTDDTAAIQAAITATGQGTLYMPSGTYLVTTLTIPEGIKIIGDGISNLVSSAIAGGTWITSTTTGNVIDIDGQWTGFLSRRGVEIDGINVLATGVGSVIINCDFLTQSKFSNMYLRGAAGSIGLNLINSYNNSFDRVRVEGASGAGSKGVYLAVKDDAGDNVFSGQSIFTGCDFWGAERNIEVFANRNVMTQVVFLKCHTLTGAYGVFINSNANLKNVDFLSCHFEAHTTNNVAVINLDTGSFQFKVNFKGCTSNNDSTITHYWASSEHTLIEDCYMLNTTVGQGIGINIQKAGVIASRNHFANLSTGILIPAATNYYPHISRNIYSGCTATLTDNSRAYVSENKVILTSDSIDLAAGGDNFVYSIPSNMYLANAYYMRETATNTGSIINVGVNGTEGKYVNGQGVGTGAIATVVFLTKVTTAVDSGDEIKIQVPTAGTGTGLVRIVLELQPVNVNI